MKKKDDPRKKILDILEPVPRMKDIFLSDADIETKRKEIRYFLSDMLMATFDDNPTIPPLEWILVRNAVNVFRSVLSCRSERLSGFSMLGYIDDLIHRPGRADLPSPSRGFLAEFTHLVRAVVGKTHIYNKRVPAFTRHEGQKASQLRSQDLTRMARQMTAFLGRYTSGLDEKVVARRRDNQARIKAHFKADAAKWDDWKWQIRHVIRDADTLGQLVCLSEAEHEAVKHARRYRLPFGITPYYLSLMDHETGSPDDRAVRAQVIPSMTYVRKMKQHRDHDDCSADFMIERDTTPITGITRRYPQIVILKPVLTCPQICVYCQRNWEIEEVGSSHAALSAGKLEKAYAWLAHRKEINEVLVTGGDPLYFPDDRIEEILTRLSAMDHIERIRIGTRTPVTLPMRITEGLLKMVARFHVPGKREILIVTHFEHLYEITPEAMEAVQRFRRAGMGVYNQLVFTFYNSRKFETCALRHGLRLIGVTPYYTFNTKGKEETNDFRVPIARLLQEQHEEARLMPGSVRTDEIVFNVPRLGKNYLRAAQHRDIISILPNGRRVYEFHPWEKKFSYIKTYVYIDVSIQDYLDRLAAVGEDVADYRTIWYYY